MFSPFDENNEVNYYELKHLISYQLASGTKAIVILGTTGEASTISMAEREKIIRFAVCEINHKVPLIVGTGSNSTETAITLTRQAEELGADGVLVVSPYYNKCNDAEQSVHPCCTVISKGFCSKAVLQEGAGS